MTVIDKRAYAQAVRSCVMRAVYNRPDDLFGIQAQVGFDIGATDEQVKYAVRVLRMDGAIGYDKNHAWYYAITAPTREAE